MRKTTQKKHKNKGLRFKNLDQLEQINLNAAGIDIGAEEHYVAVPNGRDSEGEDVRHFHTFTADLLTRAEWLKTCDIDTVAMESTGVYWIPLFEILDSQGFDVKLMNPRFIKNVPGRKTDVLDCQWIQQLRTYGLLQGAFRPDDKICELRSYLQQRSMLISYASQHIQHMQKALEQMNIKLSHVITDITGATGMRIIRSILAGERDPGALARMRNPNGKNSERTIAKSLQKNGRSEHLFALQQAVDRYDFYKSKMIACESRIHACLETFEDRTDGTSLPKSSNRSGGSRHKFHFDSRTSLYRMTGVDLTQIDDIDTPTVLTIIGAIGIDMRRWPTDKHCALWLVLCLGSSYGAIR
jgi:hypothetical protein